MPLDNQPIDQQHIQLLYVLLSFKVKDAVPGAPYPCCGTGCSATDNDFPAD